SVHYDPSIYGPLLPGGTLARQFAFTLPTDDNGAGNIQITVNVNVNHTAFEQGTSLVNGNLRSLSSSYPAAPTTVAAGGVDFALMPIASSTNSLGVLQTGFGGPNSFDIGVHIAGATTAYTLINSDYGSFGATAGTIEFKGTGGLDAAFSLVEGTNIRDYNNDGYNNQIAAGTPSLIFANGQVRLDTQTFALPAAFATGILTDI